MTWMQWYDNLAKPSWTPTPSTISLIWIILYPIIVISFVFVFVQTFRGKIPRLVALPFIWSAVAVWPHFRWVAAAQVPYFVWVSIATVIQLSITWMNW